MTNLKTLTIALLTSLTAACTTSDGSDRILPMEGTWDLTLTPERAPGDCVEAGVLSDRPMPGTFSVVITDDGPLVNAGQTDPGLTEYYNFTEVDETTAKAVITSFYYNDRGQIEAEGRMDLTAAGKTVSGSARLQIYSANCRQAYSVTGVVKTIY